MTMTVLLVDDHPLFRDGMRHVLAQFGEPVAVSLAHDCESAMRMAGECDDLDLVLLDVNLPGGSGLSCLRLLRVRFPLVPVVMLSAIEDSALMQQALEQGAQGYIPKSSTTEVMLNAVRLVLGGGVYVPKQALAPRTVALDSAAGSTLDASALTPRQRDVLRLLAQGQSNKEIARALSMSEGTVRVHVTAILRALGVTNRTQAGLLAARQGLLADTP